MWMSTMTLHSGFMRYLMFWVTDSYKGFFIASDWPRMSEGSCVAVFQNPSKGGIALKKGKVFKDVKCQKHDKYPCQVV